MGLFLPVFQKETQMLLSRGFFSRQHLRLFCLYISQPLGHAGVAFASAADEFILDFGDFPSAGDAGLAAAQSFFLAALAGASASADDSFSSEWDLEDIFATDGALSERGVVLNPIDEISYGAESLSTEYQAITLQRRSLS